MKRGRLFIFFAAILLSCGGGQNNLKPYYFPYAEFQSAKVYVFVDQNDSNNVSYWNFKTFVQGTDTFFTTTVFNKELKPNTIYVNSIKNDGAYLEKMIQFVQDTIQLTYNIKQNEVFKWELQASQSISMLMNLQVENAVQELFTERRFETKPKSMECMGKMYPCIEVIDRMQINMHNDNRTVTEERFKTGYFAKGIGLIEFTTSFTNGTQEHFKLEKILDENAWSNLIKN